MMFIKHDAGTMLCIFWVAKHCLSCRVTATVTASDQLPDWEDYDSNFHQHQSGRTSPEASLAGVHHVKYDLHEFVTSRTTI